MNVSLKNFINNCLPKSYNEKKEFTINCKFLL